MEQLTMSSTTAFARTQKGVVLFIALIVLVALSLAGIALVRSVDTSNVIAGNLAFKQGTIQAGDIGVEAAVNVLPTIIASSLNSDQTTTTYWYYATRRETDTAGVPTTKQYGGAGTATAIDWSTVPIAQTLAGNSVQIVIDRLCRPPLPVVDVEGQCFAEMGGGGSKKVGADVFDLPTTLYYRATVRVSGPRNSISMVQAILSR
jgi:type IV pilus assembly protein PilX